MERPTAADARDARPVVLVVEDDVSMRALIAQVLQPLAARVLAVVAPQHALDCLENEEVAVVVTDLRMPRVDGLEMLKFARQKSPNTLVVLITGYATVESAVEALKRGAYDYLKKPFEPADLLKTIERALEYYLLHRENLRLREASRVFVEGEGLIGKSAAINDVQRLINASAGYDCSVLITGESGTGKEVVAKQIHATSRRREKRFIAINCAAIPENIIESELFGHTKGAFTGADRNKPGLFEAANGGTLFLDEINNASLSLQAKLLRVLQDGTFFQLGDTQPRRVDARLEVTMTGQAGYRVAVTLPETKTTRARRPSSKQMLTARMSRRKRFLTRSMKRRQRKNPRANASRAPRKTKAKPKRRRKHETLSKFTHPGRGAARRAVDGHAVWRVGEHAGFTRARTEHTHSAHFARDELRHHRHGLDRQ